MNPELWFKNFNMVIELDVAGEFIYNGLQEIYQTSCFRNDAHTFLALYNLSVGIERLQKIIITLWEFKDSISPEEFKEELRKIGHNHISLRDKIISLVKGTKAEKASSLTSRENDFLEVLCHFYSDNRYMRYRAYQDTDGEVVLLKNYLTKYADTDQSIFDDLIIVNDKIKRLLGKTISGISKKYYELVREGSRRNGTFTYELREESKAAKVFRYDTLYSEKYEEHIAFKEMIIYLHNTNEKHPFLKYIEEIEPLPFEVEFISGYIEDICNGNIPQQLVDEADALYENIENGKERREMLSLIGNPNVDFEFPHIKKCLDIINSVVENETIDKEAIKALENEKEYILEDDIIELINEVEALVESYFRNEIETTTLVEKIKRIYEPYKSPLYAFDVDN